MQGYSSEDCVVILCSKDSHGNEKSFKIDSFPGEDVFCTPERYHWVSKGEDGLWQVSVKHKNGRIAKVKLSDESYHKYGIDKLDPFVQNFNLDYNDKDLVEIK